MAKKKNGAGGHPQKYGKDGRYKGGCMVFIVAAALVLLLTR